MVPTDQELQQAFSELAHKLIADQRQLEPEAQRILDENAWDLYEWEPGGD
jgi:hypothetical protein